VLEHVTITASDFARSLSFYDGVLKTLGLARLEELVDEEEDEPELEAVAWGEPGGAGVIWLVTGTTPTSGVHLRMRADSRAQVETFARAAVASGGSVHTAPRRWALYRRGEFNAIVSDPDGNLIEAVAAE
jgi:catechol 2,3-dioxygenase-like lactoylglutathione lyase family enzyme